MKFFHALLKCPMKWVVLVGKDETEAIRFDWKRCDSPSLHSLHEEIVETEEDEYSYVIYFKNLSATQIIDKIIEVKGVK